MTLEERIREIMYQMNVYPEKVKAIAPLILQAFEEVIPEECKDYVKVESYIDGWNDCLAELRKNMGGGK